MKLKLLLISLLIGFGITLFIGSPVNSPEKYLKDGSWGFINRGWPIAWAGVTLAREDVKLPIWKLPLRSFFTDMSGNVFFKIIDLRYFLPLLFLFSTLAFPVVFIVVMAAKESKHKFFQWFLWLFAIGVILFDIAVWYLFMSV